MLLTHDCPHAYAYAYAYASRSLPDTTDLHNTLNTILNSLPSAFALVLAYVFA